MFSMVWHGLPLEWGFMSLWTMLSNCAASVISSLLPCLVGLQCVKLQSGLEMSLVNDFEQISKT